MAKRMRKLLVTPHRKSAKHLSQGKSRLSILLDPMCTALADGICVFQGQNLSTRIIFSPSLFLLLHVKLISTIKIWIC